MESVLRPIAVAFRLLGNVVHAQYFPFPWMSTLHAARVSLAFQSNTRRLKTHSELGWKSYLAGFCIMAWGGMIFSHLLLNLPPPVLYAYQPWINYLAVHLLLTAAFSAAPSLPTNAELLSSLDLVLFPLDAILRTNAITSTLAHLSPGSQLISPILSHSPLFHFVLGCTASSGGGISAATLGVWNPNWGSGGFTPAFLRKGPRSPFNGILNTLDVWGGGVVAVIYGISTSHIAFHPLVVYLSPYIRVFSLIDTKEIKPLSPLGGKSLAAAALMVLFGVRALSARLQTLPLPPGTAQGKGKI